MYLLGYDIGSSFIKASLLDAKSGIVVSKVAFPDKEMKIIAHFPGWAEQDPELWWRYTVQATKKLLDSYKINSQDIKAIGISYQMHGLVLVDEDNKSLRNSIIWCDSRAVQIGENAYKKIGKAYCLKRYLNSPGNFTISKLKWVKDNEKHIYSRINKFMLPGDYIALKMTNKICITEEGLSEAILWDYDNQKLADEMLKTFDISSKYIPEIVNSFSIQGGLTSKAAAELGLSTSTVVSYRAGDQPNNAFSLGVLNPGEVAATAGTSGVIFGISNQNKYEQKSRVNVFLSVNHKKSVPRYGMLLCINGTGILYRWLKENFAQGLSYEQMNEIAGSAEIGSGGVLVLPFGNGAERVLENRDIGCKISNIRFNTLSRGNIFRAVQEGIAFSMYYGLNLMKEMGVDTKVIKAGYANMFLSPIFCQTLSDITGAVIELYNTDGSIGAARGAGIGVGIYSNTESAFVGLKKIKTIKPINNNKQILNETYSKWLELLQRYLDKNRY
jgi:xylulokinase